MFIKKDAQLPENFDERCKLHSSQVDDYLKNYIVPDLISFYLGTGYYKSCLFEDSLDIYIESIFEFFNNDLKITKKLKDEVKKQLQIKFGLKVTNENPLILQKREL